MEEEGQVRLELVSQAGPGFPTPQTDFIWGPPGVSSLCSGLTLVHLRGGLLPLNSGDERLVLLVPSFLGSL